MLAHLRKGETYADLATGFDIGTTTVFRYVQEALEVLLKSWKILRKIRCCPHRATDLVKAVLVLIHAG